MNKHLEKLFRVPTVVDPYEYKKVRIVDIEDLAPDHRMFTLKFLDEEVAENFNFVPGQFIMLTIPKAGEIPLSICSSPTRKGFIQITVRRTGRKTKYLYTLKEGDLLAVRGPYGNGFPMDLMKGHNVLIIAGGLGLAPLRSVIWYVLDKRDDYKEVWLLYGTRSYELVLYKEELERLRKRSDIKTLYALDRFTTPEDEKFADYEGYLPGLIPKVNLNPEDTYVTVCGPPIAYKFIGAELIKNGYHESKIFVSLERKMECGIGKCGHCQVGYKLTCVDGPVFPLWDTKNLPNMI
jgi:NAD(P)H-flavin reductase